MDNAQARMKSMFQGDPLLRGIKLKLYRDTIGNRGLQIILQSVNDASVTWFIEEI